MMVIILLSISKLYLSMLVWGQTGGIVVKSKRFFLEGDKQDSFFNKKDKNRMDKMELIIIYKRRRFQAIYRVIYTRK